MSAVARSAARRRVSWSALVVAVLVAASAGCSSPARPTGAAHPPGTASAGPTTAGPVPVRPLTGVPGAPVDRPAIAVKVENSVQARPQTGLGAADLVYEEVVEGGITRYVAVYQSSLPTAVGPVRSIRPMDAGIVGPLHGLFAFAGGLQPYIDAAGAAGLQLLSGLAGLPGFTRTSDRSAPHNLYADLHTLEGLADAGHRAAPPPQFSFPPAGGRPTALTAGVPTRVLDLTLSGVSHPRWTWDAASGRWLRSEGAVPAVTTETGRIGATNVVVLRVHVVDTPARDAAGNPVPDTLLSGSGAALVASGGRTVAATWTKRAVTEPIALTGATGSAVTLAPGNTWIELVPDGTGAVTLG
jgi:hypothetical protein